MEGRIVCKPRIPCLRLFDLALLAVLAVQPCRLASDFLGGMRLLASYS